MVPQLTIKMDDTFCLCCLVLFVIIMVWLCSGKEGYSNIAYTKLGKWDWKGNFDKKGIPYEKDILKLARGGVRTVSI